MSLSLSPDTKGATLKDQISNSDSLLPLVKIPSPLIKVPTSVGSIMAAALTSALPRSTALCVPALMNQMGVPAPPVSDHCDRVVWAYFLTLNYEELCQSIFVFWVVTPLHLYLWTGSELHVFISFRVRPHHSCQGNQQHSFPQQDPQSSNRHSTQRTLTGQVRLFLLFLHLNLKKKTKNRQAPHWLPPEQHVIDNFK